MKRDRKTRKEKREKERERRGREKEREEKENYHKIKVWRHHTFHIDFDEMGFGMYIGHSSRLTAVPCELLRRLGKKKNQHKFNSHSTLFEKQQRGRKKTATAHVEKPQ